MVSRPGPCLCCSWKSSTTSGSMDLGQRCAVSPPHHLDSQQPLCSGPAHRQQHVCLFPAPVIPATDAFSTGYPCPAQTDTEPRTARAPEGRGTRVEAHEAPTHPAPLSAAYQGSSKDTAMLTPETAATANATGTVGTAASKTAKGTISCGDRHTSRSLHLLPGLVLHPHAHRFLAARPQTKPCRRKGIQVPPC